MDLTVPILLATNAGSIAAAAVTLWRAHHQRQLDAVNVEQVEADLSRRYNNRRIQLERYADDVARYHRALRDYLLALADDKVIDMSRVDLTRFPPPPLPAWENGGR